MCHMLLLFSINLVKFKYFDLREIQMPYISGRISQSLIFGNLLVLAHDMFQCIQHIQSIPFEQSYLVLSP